MKKYYFNLFIALLGVVGFTACSSDDDDYQWATVSGNQVYFSNQLPSSYNISKSTSSITVPINRVKTDEAITVNLAHTDGTGFFNVPSTVSFAAGESVANITVSYDPEKVAYDENHKDTIKIASADYTTIYGANSYAFSAMMPSPYKLLGNGVLSDAFWGFTTSVQIYQNQEQPNTFRIFGGWNPVDAGNQDDYLQITILQPGDVVAGQTITSSDLVFWSEDFNTGYHHSTYDADILVCHPYGFNSTKDQSMWAHNKVNAYQDDGVTPGEVQLAPFYYMNGVGGWNYTQNDKQIVITFPGYDPKDYSIGLQYLGRLTTTSDDDYAQVAIDMGDDIEFVKYGVADDLDALYEQLTADADPEGWLQSDGAVNWGLEESGIYKFLAVGFAGGEAVAAESLTFQFTSSHEFAPQFTPVGIGTFTYTQYWEGDDEGLTISKAEGTNLYRISHWGYDVNFDFTWDPATNKCTVGEQYIGTEYKDYGAVFVSDLPTYDPEESTYDDFPCFYDPATKTFTFNLVYYVGAGALTYGAETFTVQWDEAAAAPKHIVKKSPELSMNFMAPRKFIKKADKAHFTQEKRLF